MANIIRIKRTSTTAITTGTLAIGELAYSSLAGTQSNTGDRIFIGTGASDATSTPIAIGGKYFTDFLKHVPGTLTASAALLVDSNSKIDVINVGNITITGNTGVISSTNTNGNITLTPNGSGYVQVSGTNAFVLPVGTTAQQGPALTGAIRYNTTTSSFEGYTGASGSGQWASLGGVRSVDGLTYIIAETTPGASDDTLHFYAATSNSTTTEAAQLTSSALKLLQTTANTGNATSGALQVAGGAGIAGNLYVGSTLTVNSTSSFTDLATFNNGVTVSGSTSAATEYFRITNGAGTPVTTFLVDTASGNTTIAGTLGVTGAATFAGISGTTGSFSSTLGVTGATTLSSTLSVSGASTLAALSATTGSFSSTLGVTGATTLSSTLDVAGNFNVNTNKFQVAAATGNTTVGGTLTVSGTSSFSGNLAMNNFKITGLAEPAASNDAVTKSYVDSMSQGLHVHAPVDFATTTDIATALSITVTYTAGPATGVNLGDPGPSSYLTFSASPTFTYYNVSTGANESATFANHSQARVLVLGQTDQKQNGIYYWATSTTFVRAIDADASYWYNGAAATLSTGTAVVTLTSGSTATLKVGMPVFKVGGTGVLGTNPYILSVDSATQVTLTVNHATAGAINLAFGYGDLAGGDYIYVADTGYGYVQTSESVIFGTSNITFSQFAGQGAWTAGAGLTLTGNQFSINLGSNSGLTTTGNTLQLNSTVAGNGLSYSSGVITATGTTNRISVSGSGIDISSAYVGQASITTVGTISSGTWQGTAIGAAYGGTGIASYAVGDIIYASASTTLSKLAKGTDGQVLMMSGGLPAWGTMDGGTF